MTDYLEQIKKALVEGKHADIEALVKQALETRIGLDRLINEGLIPAMDNVGQNFSEGRIFVPEMLVSAMTMKKALGVLKPRMAGMPTISQGKILIATVQGDLHDIGKNLVAIMLRGAGYEVIDLGNDVSPERFIKAAQEAGAALIGMSALLTTTMPAMKEVTALLEEKGLRGRIRTIIGGAPVSDAFARQIGADAYAYDAASAVERVRALVE